MAADLVSRAADVIAAIGPPSASAAKNATSTIPVVFMVGTDPVADRLIVSLSRPGGNLTGTSMLAFDLTPKRMELILELVPQAAVIALLVNPNNAYAEHMIGDLQQAARARGVQLSVLKASNESEIDAAFASLDQRHARALVVDPEPFLASRSGQIVAQAARHAIPAIYGWRLYAEAGGLISYGPSLSASVQQVGNYVGRILKGERPADLPVQQPTKFELVINLKTAKALGLCRRLCWRRPTRSSNDALRRAQPLERSRPVSAAARRAACRASPPAGDRRRLGAAPAIRTGSPGKRRTVAALHPGNPRRAAGEGRPAAGSGQAPRNPRPRHCALLACAILRQHGVAARLRVGFADYFTPGFHEDHWVCEVDDGGDWRLLDAELTAEVRERFAISFDPADAPREHFLVAADAWWAIRRGERDAARFGVSAFGLGGMWFVAGSLLRDLAALAMEEMMPWDYWGPAREFRPGSEIPPDWLDRLDSLADALAREPAGYDDVRSIIAAHPGRL